MTITDIFYRVNQFSNALFAGSLSLDENRIIQELLTSEQQKLFLRLERSEQKHSLRVLRTLIDEGETSRDLLVAALLHDIGKTRSPLNIWERVLVVLGKAFFPEYVKRWETNDQDNWRRPFVVAKTHPQWGAEMALEAGASPLTIALIRRHQEQLKTNFQEPMEDRLLKKLQEADRKN
ncbi:MAG TPA: HD domain-containing protein [Anaerolineae bacterium]|nr:HD domain-containing protein [Anaerolineae bacterium]